MKTRLRSLDYFRGVTIVSMIVVNNPGSWSQVYPALLHAPWHGWTPTDLIFPFFLFIVGAAIPFSLGARVEAGTPRARLLGRVARRSGILVALGLLLAAYPFFDLADLRLPGVLQRIGAAYLVTGAAFLYFSRRGLLSRLPADGPATSSRRRTSRHTSTASCSPAASTRAVGIRKASSPRFRRSPARSSACSPGRTCEAGVRRRRRLPGCWPPDSSS